MNEVEYDSVWRANGFNNFPKLYLKHHLSNRSYLKYNTYSTKCVRETFNSWENTVLINKREMFICSCWRWNKNKINQDIAEFAVVTEFHHRLYKFLFLGLCFYEETHFYSLVPPCLSRQNRMCTAENISLKFARLLWIWQMSAACSALNWTLHFKDLFTGNP